LNALDAAYDHIVSLGCACDTAFNLKRVVPGVQTHLFDWVLTTDDGILIEISRDPAAHFDPGNLEANAKGQMTDVVTGTRFIHEFVDYDQRGKTAAHQARIAFLKNRWRGLMSGTGRALFVRRHGKSPDPVGAAQRLLAGLRAGAPAMQVDLLYLVPDASLDICKDEPGLMFRARPAKDPANWQGNAAEWDVALRDIRRVDPAMNAAR
jgi:hypothetical protein